MQPCGFRAFTWTWPTTFKLIKHKTDREIDTSATSVLWVPYIWTNCATSKGTKYWRSLAVAIKEQTRCSCIYQVTIYSCFCCFFFVYCKVLFDLSGNCEWMWHVCILYFLIFMPISMRKVKKKKLKRVVYIHIRDFLWKLTANSFSSSCHAFTRVDACKHLQVQITAYNINCFTPISFIPQPCCQYSPWKEL